MKYLIKISKLLFCLLVLLTCTHLSVAQDIATDTILAKSYFEKAGIYENKTQFDSAIVYFEKASELYQEHNMWRKYLQSATRHGVCYTKQWKLDQAIAIIKPAINKTLQHINENDDNFGDAYQILGFQYVYQSKFDTTLIYWKKSLEIRKELLGENHPLVAQSYNNIGNVYAEKNEYDLALQSYFTSLQIKKELLGENHIDVAVNYNNVGNVYCFIDEYDLALQNFFKSLQIYEELLGEKHASTADSYHNIGGVYARQAELDLALHYYLKALHIKLELLGEKNPSTAESYNNIGVIYMRKSQHDLALEYYLKSLQIYKELLGENHISIAYGYGNIGGVYMSKNEYDLALEYYYQALQICNELLGEKHTDVALTYKNIGHVHKNRNEYDRALEFYSKSIEIYKELLGEKHTSVAQGYGNIGDISYSKNEYDLAIQQYFNAIHIYKELLGDKHSYLAGTYINIGDSYKNLNEYDLALQNYQKGVASSIRNYYDTINVHCVPVIQDYLSWQYLLEALYRKAGIFVSLSAYTKPGCDLDSLQQKSLSGFENSTSKDYLKLALHHYNSCDTIISQARKEMKTKSDKIAIGNNASEIYKDAVNVCLSLSAASGPDSAMYYKERAFYFSERNKSSVLLEALAGAEAQKFAGISDTLLKKEHKLQIDIALYKKILSEQPDSEKEILFRDKLFNANRKYDDLIAVFEDQYPEYFELKYNSKPASIKDIQKILDDNTAIISYFTGDSVITIFTITTNNLDVKAVPTIENLTDTIRDFRYGLLYANSSRFSEVYKKYALKLHDELIPENGIKGISNLIIIPDVELGMIPFETLLTEYPGDKEWKELPYLIKKYNISYSYSANLFYKTFPKNPSDEIENTDLNNWLAFAPVFDDSNTAGLTMRTREQLEQFGTNLDDTTGSRRMLVKGGYVSPLPGTKREVQVIFKQFNEKGKKALAKINLSANEDYLKSGVLKNYKIIHFATHGFVNTEKPELSGILFAQDTSSSEDGILYTGEIYNLKLNTDLTVLSACETGLGKIEKGEGLIGLTRALLYAGSKNIIVSLWKVEDTSTSDLMIDFYKNLLDSPEEQIDFSSLLRTAKLKMIDEEKYAHPFYWSPFILVGK